VAHGLIHAGNFFTAIGDINGTIDPMPLWDPFTPTSKYFGQRGKDTAGGLMLVNGARAVGGGLAGLAEGAASRLSAADFPEVAEKISQKQLRHIAGRKEYRGGGMLDSVSDAQKVLDAYRAGAAQVLGKSQAGFPVVRFEGVTGINVNLPRFPSQPTNVFMIKGTSAPSVVPMNPTWTP
jgi:hypothetical protein